MKPTVIAAICLCLAPLFGAGAAAQVFGTEIERPVVLNSDGTWAYLDDIEETGVTGFDRARRGVRLFEKVDAQTGAVTRTWVETGTERGRIDVAIARVVETVKDAAGRQEGCIPVFTTRNLSGHRVDRLLVGIEFYEGEARLGGFSFMVGPLDDGEFRDTGGQLLHASDCGQIDARMAVLECRATFNTACVTDVTGSDFGTVPLRLVPTPDQ